MNIHNWQVRLFQIIRFLWVVLLVYVGVKVVLFATPLLYPFLISILIALAINPLVNLLSNRAKFPRWLGVIIALILLLAIVVGAVTLVVTFTVIEIGNLTAKLPHTLNELSGYVQSFITQETLNGIYNRIQFMYAQLDPSYQETVKDTIGKTVSSISQGSKQFALNFLDAVKTLLLSLPNLATVFVISLMGAFFISKDFYLWRNRFRRILPQRVNSRMDTVILDLRNALVGFIKAQITLVAITAVIVIIGLLIMGVPYAVTIGLLTGVVDLLPYLGTGTIFVPWIVYMFFKGNYSLVIGLSILYAVVLIVRQIIEPKVVAENVGLDPLLTLVALFIGYSLFGFLGLIVGPVSLVLINALFKACVHKDVWLYIKGT
ncbi:sporulation integral membrane protein YtvI [Brevibacillus fluminis]|uniref:Sporulation integral membrane protein YtvI n=1 Tax=Brevibacillus fluminis TaxID=511487 RepID=A0A3M8DN94_9BACL|nr:sporulation integral membrane protein YtvI [Brevibacillus fluminis]RNB89553.1 sporulation integral membrane protein YtvI [Brevibacillus fluminis]